MSIRAMHMLTGKRAGWVAGGVVVSVAILAVVGYRAVTEWQRSAALLAQRRADAAAEQLLTALTRDMRGAQTSVLAAMPLDLATPDLLLDLGFVGSAFARYPYVEAFFASIPRRNGQSHMTYYVRTDRMPPWLPSAAGEVFFPVVPMQSPGRGRCRCPGRRRRSAAACRQPQRPRGAAVRDLRRAVRWTAVPDRRVPPIRRRHPRATRVDCRLCSQPRLGQERVFQGNRDPDLADAGA